MYDNLNDTSKSSGRQLARYITLLQCWIYEHFSSGVEAITADDYHERKPHAFVVMHQPERVVRQFGYVQTIPPYSSGSRLCIEDIDNRWMHFSKYPAPPEHPIRHLYVTQDDTYVEPDIPQYPVAPTAVEEAPAHAPSHVEQPRHAMEDCQSIAERLERLLNLRIVTEDTEAYNVMEYYLRIAKGVTADHNIYVRSRRRRRIEDT
ncbi:uncharacterized protein LOC114375631 [Glycine soja]|uniref:uncharacterized protein LOC114375631 n=1 Tax=Glycine soja TaxID=3848 RepID=UPI00103EAC22|nr:uncharacterized protein LOC114375631 [Glycine soja]